MTAPRRRSRCRRPPSRSVVAEGIDGIDDIDALRVVGDRAVPAGLRWQGDDGVADVEVRHRDGRAWRVLVRQPRPRAAAAGVVRQSPIEPHVWVADPPVADRTVGNTSAGA